MQIKDTIILVTGGASGLGASTVIHLAELGAKLIILDTQQKEVMSIANQVDGLGIVCDVTNESSVQQALQQASTKFGVARVCINCAGILGSAKLISKDGPMSLEHFKNVIDVDLVGTFNVMRLTAQQMLNLTPIGDAQERGVIINLASIAAFEGQIGQVAYSAAKAGVVGMTLPAARELAQYGIRVTCIAPGIFDTPMLQNASDKVREQLIANTVFPKRLGRPAELALFIDQIISNPMINGDVMRLDGAIRLPPK